MTRRKNTIGDATDELLDEALAPDDAVEAATLEPVAGETEGTEMAKQSATLELVEGRERDATDVLSAVHENFAVIEFAPDGTILRANDLFLGAMGYEADEIVGQHHRMFCSPNLVASQTYADFWASLAAGQSQTGEFMRLRKDGSRIWLHASYTCIRDEAGEVVKVVKFAQDITERKLEAAETTGKMSAIDKAQAVIEFNLDGTIITANDNFLTVLGYTLDEIQGQHHRMFAEPEYAQSAEYRQFWEKLNRGEYDAGQYKRLGKGGKVIWIEASYNPILDADGNPFKVVKFATDITAEKLEAAETAGKMSAIDKAQAVIEFNLDGTIITANDNFLNTVGYTLEEVKGQHHRIFAEPAYAQSAEYRQFWEKLNRGEYDAGQYKRLGKDGKAVWIQASYNPILDADGQPFKVVKFATEITEERTRTAEFEGKIAAVEKAQAVIEFNLDGTIITANDNFLNVVGYSLAEIQGQHHRMFAEPEYGQSAEYRKFWEKLNRGEYDTGQYKRICKDGSECWIQASYNPIMDADGQPFKVVKFATDITEEKIRNADFEGQLDAINKSQGVIEFNLDGTIITANDNFLNVVGYSLAEIQGQHHRMFAEPEYAQSAEYRQFWEKLNRGEFDQGEYRRVGKGGVAVWIQASYNPIFDVNGNPYKVVKYATDLTQQKAEYNSLVDTFGVGSDELKASADQLSATANQMASGSEETSVQSKSAATAAQEVASGMNSVAASVEEMVASIKEISSSSAEASAISKEAATQAAAANNTITELSDASTEIGNVIKMISSIAEQTNLLALNATIEAARAGEAGRGFAVVANEVKELAKQTAQATEDITGRIGNVQGSAQSAVSSLADITQIIDKLNEIATGTATAVEEQASVTNEVSRVVAESNSGVDSIAQNISGVAEAAEQSATGASETLDASQTLSSLADKLAGLVEAARKD